MKLYVWVDPYEVAYGSSLVVAIADTLREARKQAATGKAYAYGDSQQPTPAVPLGKPTRIISLPCAEWHYWAE